MKNPKILIISNNVMCDWDNNGQTILSLFEELPPESVSQLYFSSDNPSITKFTRYFQISDNDVLKKLFHKNISCGSVIIPSTKTIRHHLCNNKFKRYTFIKLLREYMWWGRWKSSNLENWISEEIPEIIFFVAGDSLFAYDICKHIKEKAGSKLITFITDDYITTRISISPFWYIKRLLLLETLKKCLNSTDKLITISNDMKSEYKELFGIDSVVYANIREDVKKMHSTGNQIIRLTYAGTLEHKRYKTLSKIAESIKQYNREKDRIAACLEIYSSENSKKIRNLFKKYGNSCKFNGFVDKNTLKKKYMESDILVYAEAFNYKSRKKIRLSISTKILDYLSFSKPILAVGPEEVASMKLLNDVAICSYNNLDIKESVYKLLDSEELRNNKGEQARNKFIRDYQHMKTGFLKSIIECIDSDS